MVYDADVIVVGAGPAGSLSAFMLASQGIRVLLFEKAQFPRYKICGGGLTHKILNEIPFDLSPVIESTIHSFRFSHKYTNVFTRNSPDPLMYCTMRGDLDNFLLQKAIDAGAFVRMGSPVISVSQDVNGVTASTKNNTFHGRLLIGSEGASGIVSRTAGLRANIEIGLAWEAEVFAEEDDLKRYAQTVFLDWGTFPGGYAWVFPKKDHFSIGVGGPVSLQKQMLPYYEKFIGSISESIVGQGNGICFGETRSKSFWPIPVRTQMSSFHNDFIMVTGDSAGLGDPLTGEGIYYAVRSGEIAAESCINYLSGKSNSINDYSMRINEELMTELLEANRIKHIFNAVPLKIHSFVGSSERGWKAFCKVLRGERWYADVRNAFGKWKFLWNLACWISASIEIHKERKLKIQAKKERQ